MYEKGVIVALQSWSTLFSSVDLEFANHFYFECQTSVIIISCSSYGGSTLYCVLSSHGIGYVFDVNLINE